MFGSGLHFYLNIILIIIIWMKKVHLAVYFTANTKTWIFIFFFFSIQQWSALLSFLEGVTTVALCALATAEKTAHSPAPFLETAIILHGMIAQCVIYMERLGTAQWVNPL